MNLARSCDSEALRLKGWQRSVIPWYSMKGRWLSPFAGFYRVSGLAPACDGTILQFLLAFPSRLSCKPRKFRLLLISLLLLPHGGSYTFCIVLTPNCVLCTEPPRLGSLLVILRAMLSHAGRQFCNVIDESTALVCRYTLITLNDFPQSSELSVGPHMRVLCEQQHSARDCRNMV